MAAICKAFFPPGIRKRITELEDMKNRRLNSLRGKHRDTYNAVMWLRDNQDKFQGTVYEPILMQVSRFRRLPAPSALPLSSLSPSARICSSRSTLIQWKSFVLYVYVSLVSVCRRCFATRSKIGKDSSHVEAPFAQLMA